MMTFVIGVGKKGIGQHLCCASKQEVDLSYAIKTGKKKEKRKKNIDANFIDESNHTNLTDIDVSNFF